MNKKLITPGLILLIVIVITVTILLFTGPRMSYQPSVRSFDEEMPLPPEDVVSFSHQKFDPRTVTFPVITKENLEKGRIYYTYYCVFCHGTDGKGNGEVGKSYIPKPAELKNIAGLEKDQLYYKSFTGIGHSPVLERVVPYKHRPFILVFIQEEFK
jgi:cytochrome c553